MNYSEIKKRDAEVLAKRHGGKAPKQNKRSSVRMRYSRRKNSLPIIVIGVLACAILCSGIFLIKNSINKRNAENANTTDNNAANNVPAVIPESTLSPTIEPTQAPTEEPSGIGSKQSIPEDVRASMMGISYPADGNARISLDELSYLTIPYHNFEGQVKNGNMIVASDLADEVIEIFSELFKIGYPIENMELIDKYNDMQTEQLDSLDRSSMGRNNTSAFCYRVVAGSNNLSNHALGRAIDLNPRTNPWVSVDGSVSPRNAEIYANRDEYDADMTNWREADKAAFIGKNTEVYRIFLAHGWEWGGEIWSDSYYDYQHFQKKK